MEVVSEEEKKEEGDRSCEGRKTGKLEGGVERTFTPGKERGEGFRSRRKRKWEKREEKKRRNVRNGESRVT